MGDCSELKQSSNKRIAKNTLMLYIRMFVMMGITLYTSRIVLQLLGVEDFGIYNVVGGIVVLFSFINGAMVTSTQRFLNFELGRGDVDEAKKVFSSSLNIHLCVAVLFVVLAETIGLWFLNTYINIPVERSNAANLVYQFTILTSVVNIIRAPYNAAIIAYERMAFYAYISIIEAASKLSIVFMLLLFCDRLIAYSILVALVTVVVMIIYIGYSRKQFQICCNHSFAYDKRRYSMLVSFSGWSLLGSVANIGANQGLNIILNIFYGVIVNAAMGLANQVNNAIYQFVLNFQTAFNPQITKLVASNKFDEYQSLVFDTSRYSFFLLFLIAVPFVCCSKDVILLWLGSEPEYAVIFAQIMVISSLFDALSGPLWVSVYAYGKIRNYQITISLLLLLTIPIAYLITKFGFNPVMALLTKLIISVIVYCYRLIYCCFNINISCVKYINNVVLRCIGVTVITSVVVGLTSYWIDLFFFEYSFLLKLMSSVILTISVIYFVGINHNERRYISNYIIMKFKRE